jgi:hypothetical protein
MSALESDGHALRSRCMLTRGEQMLALRRSRMEASPAFLRGGFRPFFLGGALWALVALALWLLHLAGAIGFPAAMDGLAWHRHEMLFGFVGAVVAGFLSFFDIADGFLRVLDPETGQFQIVDVFEELDAAA